MIETRWPCLELTHTRGWEPRDAAGDRLPDYAALVGWAERSGVVAGGEAGVLLAAATERPGEAAAVLERARLLRGVLYRIFTAVARRGDVERVELEALGGFLAESGAHQRVVRVGAGYGWGWGGAADDLERVLWPVIRSAGDLLTSEVRVRVRFCDADDCGWLFVDGSRNRSRRWCDMSDCGNRAKARRHRERRRAGG